MKIILVVFALLVGVWILFNNVKKVQADEQTTFDGWGYTDVAVTSAVVFNGFGRVMRIYASSGSAVGNFFILLDTPSASAVASVWPTDYAVDRRRSPAMYFVVPSTPMSGGTNGSFPSNSNMGLVADYMPYGIRIDSAAWIFKSIAASGEANHVGVLWRK